MGVGPECIGLFQMMYDKPGLLRSCHQIVMNISVNPFPMVHKKGIMDTGSQRTKAPRSECRCGLWFNYGDETGAKDIRLLLVVYLVMAMGFSLPINYVNPPALMRCVAQLILN